MVPIPWISKKEETTSHWGVLMLTYVGCVRRSGYDFSGRVWSIIVEFWANDHPHIPTSPTGAITAFLYSHFLSFFSFPWLNKGAASTRCLSGFQAALRLCKVVCLSSGQDISLPQTIRCGNFGDGFWKHSIELGPPSGGEVQGSMRQSLCVSIWQIGK